MNVLKTLAHSALLGALALSPLSNAEAESLFQKKIGDENLYEKIIKQEVPAPALHRLFEFLDNNGNKTISVSHKQRGQTVTQMTTRQLTIKDNVVVIVDFSKPSDERRLYYINLDTGIVDKHLVAHGKGSGVRVPSKFSNIDGSKMSSLGIYLTGSIYYGTHGESMNLHGLEKTNDKAAQRDIVIHAADYVSLDYAKTYSRVGRSWGCPAVAPGIIRKMLALKDGTVFYAWHKDLMTQTLKSPEVQVVTVTPEEDGKDVDLPEEEETIRKKMAEKILTPQ